MAACSAAVPDDLLTDARLEELLNPANYLGQAAEISRRILAAYPEYAAGPASPEYDRATAPNLQNGASRG